MDTSITVNAGERKVPIGRGQKQLSLTLRVDCLHNELISRLEGRVNYQAEENLPSICANISNTGAVPQQKPRTVISLQQHRGKPTAFSTSKLHHARSL